MSEWWEAAPLVSPAPVGFIPGVPKPVKPDKPNLPAGYEMGPDGVARRIPGLPADRPEGEGKALTQAQINALVERRKLLPAFTRMVDNVERLYQEGFEGDKGSVLGLGGSVNLAGRLPNITRPENETFSSAADSLIGTIAQIQGVTGGELNSLAELKARFGPMLPSPTDNDTTIQNKLTALRNMAADQAGAIEAQLPAHLVGPESPSEAPITPPPIGNVNGMDATVQRIGAPSRDGVSVHDGSTNQTLTDDPTLAGINGRVNDMLKSGRPTGEVLTFLKQAGIPERELAQLVPQLAEIDRARKSGYRGDFNVNLDDKFVPMSETRRVIADVADSGLGAAAIAAGNVVTGNHLDNLVGMTGGNAELANIGMEQVRNRNPGMSLLGDVVGGAGLYGAGRAVASRVAPAVLGGGTNALSGGAIAGDAALGGYLGSGSGGTQAFSPGNALAGAAIGAGGGVVGRGAINSLGRAVSPTGGSLAPLYAEGVQPSMGQRMGGVVNRAEQAFTSVPLLGGIQRASRNKAIDQAQRGAFNQALREIDDTLPKGVTKGTQAHTYMQRAFNKVYDKARSGMSFKPDGDFANDFGAVLRDVDLLPPSSQHTFKQLAEQVGHRIKGRGGALTGNDYKMLSSRIDAKVRAIRKNQSGDGELADVLERFSMALDDGARRHSTPEAAALLDKADRGYVKSVIIENAARGAGEAGEFSGKALENAIKSGSGGLRSRVFLRGEAPMQDYAAGMTKLGQTVADSGTIERGAALGGAAAMAHFIDPSVMAPYAANTVANLPGVRTAVNTALAPNRPGLAGVRRKIMDRAKLGSLFGIPLIEAQGQ